MTAMAASASRNDRSEDDAVEMEDETEADDRGSPNLMAKCVIFLFNSSAAVPTGVMEMRERMRWPLPRKNGWDDPGIDVFCIDVPHCNNALGKVSSNNKSCSGFPKNSAVDLECVKRKNAALTCTTL